MEQEKTGREMMEEIYNRRLHMNDLLRKVADVVDGYDYDYAGLLAIDEGGEGLDEMIEELLASTQKEYEPEKRELYYSFLYCTLLGIKWDWNLCHLSMDYGEYKPAGVLGDAVRMARDTSISTPRRKEDLLYMESVNYTNEIRGFFGYMPEVCFLLYGESVYSLYTEEEKEFVGKGRMTLEKKRKVTACPTPCGEPDAAEGGKEPDALAQAETGSVVEHAKRRIVRRIRYPEKYIRNYLRFRELSYTGTVKGELAWDREEFIKDIEEMADCYLYRKGLCAYSLEELYGLVAKCLGQMETEMRWTIRRGKKYRHWLETGTY